MTKVAVITGGLKGIGWGITRKLASDGYSVALMGTTDIQQNQEAIDFLNKNDMPYIYVQGDIANDDDRKKLLKETLNSYDRVDVLVNNAGVGPKARNDILDMTQESFDRVININLKGTTFLTQLFSKQMLKQDEINGLRGIIINIASISSTVVSISRGEYCISKAGISMLTKLFATRLASENILVYEVRPGIIKTRITEVVKDKYDEICASDELIIKRWGQPEDVADAVSLLCTGLLRYSPGEVITVDGGFTTRRL